MLVLHRRRDERVLLETAAGEVIELLVVGFKHGGVALGLEAPSTVKIVRSELLERTLSDSGRRILGRFGLEA